MPHLNSQYISSSCFWDYKIRKSDLKKPEVRKFWLERKINMCDFKGINKKDLKKYLPDLNVREDLKNLLTTFLAYENK